MTPAHPGDLSWQATSLPVSGCSELIHLRADFDCLGFLSRSSSIWYLVLPQWFDCFASVKDISCFVSRTAFGHYAQPNYMKTSFNLLKLLLYFFLWVETVKHDGHTPISDVTAGVLPLEGDGGHLLWHHWLDCGHKCSALYNLSPQRAAQQRFPAMCDSLWIQWKTLAVKIKEVESSFVAMPDY